MPLSEKQLAIMAFGLTDYDALICEGCMRSGKTSVMSVSFVEWAMENFDGALFGICGKTVKSAKMNIIRPYIALYYSRKKYKITYNGSDNLMTVRKGRVTNTFEVAGGNDERSQDRIQGRTWSGVLLDEVALMPQSFVNQALGRCSEDGSKYWFNCNPGSPTHWFKREWIDEADRMNALHLHFTLSDNPSLSERVIERYKRQYHGVFHERYVLGNWVQADGLVYPFERSQYVIPAEDADAVFEKGGESYVPGRWYVSADYGISNPFAALMCYVTRDCAYVVDEYYHDGRKSGQLTDSEHHRNIERMVGKRVIEDFVIDPSATSFKAEANSIGRFHCLNADNDVANGIAVTAKMLGNGCVKVSERCENLISEMGMYSWADGAKGDAVIKENDHACDALRYLCYTVLIDEYY